MKSCPGISRCSLRQKEMHVIIAVSIAEEITSGVESLLRGTMVHFACTGMDLFSIAILSILYLHLNNFTDCYRFDDLAFVCVNVSCSELLQYSKLL